MAGLSACTALEELYLSHNGIWRLEGLEPLVRLKVGEGRAGRRGRPSRIREGGGGKKPGFWVFFKPP
jgi:hypothetical protein